MENEIVYWLLMLGTVVGILYGFFRIFCPNCLIKRYISGKLKIPRDNSDRASGLIGIAISGYILLWLLGYVAH